MIPADILRTDPAFDVLRARAISLTGLVYWRDKEQELAEVLAALLNERGVDSAAFTARIVAEDGQGPETDALINAVTIKETFFLRSPDQFTVFEREILPDIRVRNRDRRTLSVWSAGCSNGAETYSLSLFIRRMPYFRNWRVMVLGTDIARAALGAARAGEYGDWAVRDMPPHLLDECFTRTGNTWRVRDVYRKDVVFRPHNLVTDPPPLGLGPKGTFDVVFCRNVLMYFDPATRDHVLAALRTSLGEGGWLVVAHAEANPEIARHFQPSKAAGTSLYRRFERLGRPMPDRPKIHRAPSRPPPPPPPPNPPRYCEAILSLLDRGLFSQAVEVGRDWVASHPLDPAAYYHLGLALEADAPAEAMAAFRKAITLDPAFSLALYHLSRLAKGAECLRCRRALDVSLAGPDDRELAWGDGLTVGDLWSVLRQTNGWENHR